MCELALPDKAPLTSDIMNIIFTTIALALQLSSTPIMVGRYRLWMIQHIRVGAAMICGLYAFELIYRFNMRWPL